MVPCLKCIFLFRFSDHWSVLVLLAGCILGCCFRFLFLAFKWKHSACGRHGNPYLTIVGPDETFLLPVLWVLSRFCFFTLLFVVCFYPFGVFRCILFRFPSEFLEHSERACGRVCLQVLLCGPLACWPQKAGPHSVPFADSSLTWLIFRRRLKYVPFVSNSLLVFLCAWHRFYSSIKCHELGRMTPDPSCRRHVICRCLSCSNRTVWVSPLAQPRLTHWQLQAGIVKGQIGISLSCVFKKNFLSLFLFWVPVVKSSPGYHQMSFSSFSLLRAVLAHVT